MAAIAVALGFAIVGGLLIGFLLKLPIWDNLKDDELYDDDVYWLVREPMVLNLFVTMMVLLSSAHFTRYCR